jgi:hypothetical protein
MSKTTKNPSAYEQLKLYTKRNSTDKDIYKFSFFPRTTTDWNRLPETTTSANIIESFRMQLSSKFQPSCILHTLGPCLFVYSFNCSYAEGFLVVFDMRQCKITLKMSPALYQEEEEENDVNQVITLSRDI